MLESSGSRADGKQAGPESVSSFALCFKTSWGPRYLLRKSRQIRRALLGRRGGCRSRRGRRGGHLSPTGSRCSQPRRARRWEARGALRFPPRTGRAAPRVTLHLGLGGGARPAGPPLCPSNSSPAARPDPGSQQPPAAQRRALGPGSAGWEPEARRRAELGPMGRRPSGRPRPAPPAAPGRRAPAGRDGQTDRRGPPGSPRRRRGGRRAARRRLIPAAPAGGVAERSQPEAPGLPQVTCLCPLLPVRSGDFSVRPRNFPHLLLPSPAVAQVTGARPRRSTPAGDFASCWAPVSGAVHPPVPRPVVAGVLRIRLLHGLPAAETVSGCLGKPQGGCLESALERGVEDGWRREKSRSRGKAALRGGASLGRSLSREAVPSLPREEALS